ncbi:hypothetical protein E2C01_056370 [Portunus trituberculatus]|uniref:Uncharacterized protein n=1 Tax=Portunus trituberculatus TaxID=210409 RepID=A0A5B7GYZ0_PORTR|nr:hypothetical protein [Portunus trituberculatus]
MKKQQPNISENEFFMMITKVPYIFNVKKNHMVSEPSHPAGVASGATEEVRPSTSAAALQDQTPMVPIHLFFPEENAQSFVEITPSPHDHLYAGMGKTTPSNPSSSGPSCPASCGSNYPVPEAMNRMLQVQVELNENVRDMAQSLQIIAAVMQNFGKN